MHNKDISQSYVSLKRSETSLRPQLSHTRNSNREIVADLSQNENKNLTDYDGNYLKGNNHLAVQNQVIQNILGYPVTQAIVDEQGNLILDIGDLITHQAVERAIKANVFKILLDAVYICK